MNKQQLKKYIKVLESITGKRVVLQESNEASKNLAAEAMKAVSESMDMVKQQLTLAIEKCDQLTHVEGIGTKLRGIDSIMDNTLMDITEIITSITGMDTKEDAMFQQEQPMEEEIMEESMGEDEKGIELGLDDAVKNIDSVKKVLEKGVNVAIKDENSF